MINHLLNLLKDDIINMMQDKERNEINFKLLLLQSLLNSKELNLGKVFEAGDKLEDVYNTFLSDFETYIQKGNGDFFHGMKILDKEFKNKLEKILKMIRNG